jgi:hypothetical protein
MKRLPRPSPNRHHVAFSSSTLEMAQRSSKPVLCNWVRSAPRQIAQTAVFTLAPPSRSFLAPSTIAPAVDDDILDDSCAPALDR